MAVNSGSITSDTFVGIHLAISVVLWSSEVVQPKQDGGLCSYSPSPIGGNPDVRCVFD